MYKLCVQLLNAMDLGDWLRPVYFCAKHNVLFPLQESDLQYIEQGIDQQHPM